MFRPVMAWLAMGLALAEPSAADTVRIESEIARLAEASGGTVGVAAWRLDGKGPRILVNGRERFPMASTFKVAVAGAALAAVDAGRLSLDQMVAVDPADHVPSEVIADRFIHPGVSLSLRNLLELMLTQSDNTATDVVMKTAGGPQAVTSWLGDEGISDQRIDRDTAGLLRDFFALPPGPFEQAFERAVKEDPSLVSKGSRPNPAFDNDPRDTSSPEAMAQLLTRIFTGKALSAESTQTLTGMMQRCRTGDARLRARLPVGTEVADKTGTVGGSVNDVGVITLPGDVGRVVVVVFIKKSDLPFDQREPVIADIARSIYDYYLFAGTQ